MRPLPRENRRSRSESSEGPADPQLQLQLQLNDDDVLVFDAAPFAAAAVVDDVLVVDAAASSSAAAAAVRESPQVSSGTGYNLRSRRFMSSSNNILQPRDPRRNSASNQNGREAALRNSEAVVSDECRTRVVNGDTCTGSSPLQVPTVAAVRKPDSEEEVEDGEAERLQKVKDELTCAVCLNLCYEPCTASCAHTFCKTCLIESIRACGSRCPMCRAELNLGRQGPMLNTMIWNSIRLMFPDECAERKKPWMRKRR